MKMNKFLVELYFLLLILWTHKPTRQTVQCYEYCFNDEFLFQSLCYLLSTISE